jgi:ADP-L-glycero-D-manno-heptose 6-epimerase
MIIITGAAGFIGSQLLHKLNAAGHHQIILADDFSRPDKQANYLGQQYIATVHRNQLPDWIDRNQRDIKIIFHMGARTDTTEQDTALLDRLNLHYTQLIWQRCTDYKIPLIYASSAATYGLGTLGYTDRHDIVPNLQPLNPYGKSKNDFDCWALRQMKTPPFWAGLKFFNVYGPNEYHKGRMASVVFHTAQQIKATGGMKLFRSHRPDIADGMQSRDFIYIRDVVHICTWLWQQQPASGLYNVGTGKARSFLELATETFRAMGLSPNISFIDTPADIRETYQYFTQADMTKLLAAGYPNQFCSLEEGVREYVRNYLIK